MNIAIITPGFLPVPAVHGGAIETLITNLIDQNEELGINKFDIYTIATDNLTNIKYKHTNVIQVPVSKLAKIRRRVQYIFAKVLLRKNEYHIVFGDILINKYLKSGYDLVIIENNMTLYADIYKRTNYKNNLIFHLHNDIGSNSKPEHLVKLIANTAVKIITVSDYLKDRVNSVYVNNITNVLYNSIDLKLYDLNRLTKTEVLKRKYNINSKDKIIMYSGRISADKGVKELILAFKKIEYINNAKIMIVGSPWSTLKTSDSYLDEIKTLSSSLINRIIFTGYIHPEYMPEVYALADVVVIPSLVQEAFCMVGLEAMAMKVPLIATNSGGLLEVVDKECAVIVEKQENIVENLAKAMELLLMNDELRVKMGNSGYDRVNTLEKFNKENYYQEFLRIISNSN
ncbi:glycosyltransferase family 4 protein [Robertmurraya korlensis]|uniref:glycosyltransferase family 4 protein n=1 Tax=Robertmurraya korlensis TaxID=519977 RepID=UPI00203C55F8|nr:glycosyltransferase family 4 protein [Robertmurraya korlensis]MCM3602199.1 glycosyltransferase family 4 protein [Robertmurraya korlensis]